MKKNIDRFKKAGYCVVLISLFCIGIIASTFTAPPMIEEPVEQKEWHLIPLAEGNPGAGASGVLRMYVVDHGIFDYETNITVNASVWGVGFGNNTHLNSTIPYGEAHDIVYKVRWNATHAYNSSGGGSWELDWVRGNLTSPYHTLNLQGMDEYHIVNNSNFMWVHYVWDGTEGYGGAGVTIGRGDNSTINRIHNYAYY